MNRRIPADVLPIEAAPRSLRFAGFAFDPVRSELTGPDGAPIALRPKAELLLRHFLGHPGRLFAREELMDVLWPAAVVTDDSLVQCVGELRAALDDRSQALIRTVPRRGYRFEGVVVPREVEKVVPLPDSRSRPELPDVAPAPRSRPPAGRIVLALGAVALVAALVWTMEGRAKRTISVDDELAARHVFAVMPLAVSRDDGPTQMVAAHLGDEIAAQMATRSATRAIGRTKTASFGNPEPDLERLASELHATYVLTGRVQRAAGGASLDLQLLTAPEGVSLGSARFDVETSAAAPTVAEVGQLVANFVRGKVGDLELKRATAPGHVADAADLTTIGWEEMNRMSGPDDVVRARGRFTEALRQDPDSLIALTGLAASFVSGKPLRIVLTPEESVDAERALDRLLKRAPNDATAALLWADLKLLEGRPDLAIPSIEKAVRLSPQYANGHLMLGLALIRVGRLDDAEPELERAIRLATLGNDLRRASAAYTATAEIALARGDDRRAAERARQAIAIRPSGVWGNSPYAILAAATALSGHPSDASVDMAVYRQRLPRATVATFDSTRPSRHPAFIAQRARLYAGLRLAGLPER